MNAEYFQEIARCLRYSATTITFLFCVVFISVLVPRDSSAQEEVKVKISTRTKDADGRYVPLGNVTVKIDDTSTVTTDASGQANTAVSRDWHNIKAYLQGYSVTAMHILPSAAGGVMVQETPVTSDEGNLRLPFLYPELGSYLTINMQGGVQQETEKEIALAAVSGDCKEFDEWEATSIVFSSPGEILPDGKRSLIYSGNKEIRRFSLARYGLARLKTEIKPGTYDVSFAIPHYSDPEDPLFTGSIRTSKVEVYQAFPKRELVATFPADKDGFARVMLDVGLWKDNSTPYVKVHVEKLCDLRYATVEFFEGQAEATEAFDGIILEPRPLQAGMQLFRNDTIKTGPGSKIRLKSQGGIYTITIEENTQLNIGSVITGEGRKFIEADIKKGKVQIQRIVIPKQPKPPPPELMPDPLPVVVKTPTLKVTDKQTNFAVSYDDKSGITTLGVEEGEVEITPANPSLQPFTLAANQQVQVTENNVSAITPYSGTGGNTGRILLYTGIGVVSLLALFGLFYFIRRHHRLTMRPAFHPAGVNPQVWHPPSINVSAPVADKTWRQCPNPQCGKEAPAGQERCPHCGIRLNV